MVPQTPWVIEEFELPIEYESLTAPVGVDLDQLPAKFRSVLQPHHRAGCGDLPGRLAELASRCELAGMREWLRQMSEGRRFEWRLFRGKGRRGPIADAFFAVEPREDKQHAWNNLWFYRPATGAATAHLPKPLDHIYSLIDGIGDGYPYWMNAGLVPFEDLQRRLDAWAPFHGYEPRSDMLGQVIAFWSDGTGNYDLVDHDRAIWFDHDTSTLEDRGDLTEYLDKFFRELVV